jgi:hypothetical protein
MRPRKNVHFSISEPLLPIVVWSPWFADELTTYGRYVCVGVRLLWEHKWQM